MSGGVVNRPDVDFDAVAHAYKIEGEDVLGVSTVAKVGGVDDTWGIASAWGFRIGYEGGFELAREHGAIEPFDVEVMGKDGRPKLISVKTQDDLREAMKGRGITPWATRDRAADRGNWVHDVFECLAQSGDVPNLADFPEEVRGHVESLLKWFLHFRPQFVATEVQVASRTHRFAGRYDIRAWIDARRLLPLIDPLRTDVQAERVRQLAAEADGANLPLDHLNACALVLIDLKTSKGIYPTTHFPQLEGYEGGGVEMGFPPTDCRAVVNTNGDGSFDPAATYTNAYGDEVLGNFAISWSTYDDFLAYLEAQRAVRRIKAADPLAIRERMRDEALLAQLPARSREIAELALPELNGMDSRSIGGRLGKLAKWGKCRKGEKGLWLPPE